MFQNIIVGVAITVMALPVMASGIHKKRLQPHLVEMWRIEESLSRPESVVYDRQREVIYVSNINGGTMIKDGSCRFK